MYTIVGIILGTIHILTGIILTLRRIYVIRREYIAIFIMFTATLPPILNNGLSFVWIVFLPMALLALLVHKGRFMLVNVTSEMAIDVVTTILEEKNIAHHIDDDSVILGGHERLIIFFQQSMNSVELNLREIAKLHIYNQLVEEIKIRLKGNKSTIFPSTGVFLIGVGVLLSFIMIMAY